MPDTPTPSPAIAALRAAFDALADACRVMLGPVRAFVDRLGEAVERERQRLGEARADRARRAAEFLDPETPRVHITFDRAQALADMHRILTEAHAARHNGDPADRLRPYRANDR